MKERKPRRRWMPEGRYANYFEIGHNQFEFVFDVGQLYPGDDEAMLHTRVLTSPDRAKALLTLLSRAIDAHEEAFGRIQPE